jgi:hypothetical protein
MAVVGSGAHVGRRLGWVRGLAAWSWVGPSGFSIAWVMGFGGGMVLFVGVLAIEMPFSHA